jgi:hypothetical protein
MENHLQVELMVLSPQKLFGLACWQLFSFLGLPAAVVTCKQKCSDKSPHNTFTRIIGNTGKYLMLDKVQHIWQNKRRQPVSCCCPD